MIANRHSIKGTKCIRDAVMVYGWYHTPPWCWLFSFYGMPCVWGFSPDLVHLEHEKVFYTVMYSTWTYLYQNRLSQVCVCKRERELALFPVRSLSHTHDIMAYSSCNALHIREVTHTRGLIVRMNSKPRPSAHTLLKDVCENFLSAQLLARWVRQEWSPD